MHGISRMKLCVQQGPKAVSSVLTDIDFDTTVLRELVIDTVAMDGWSHQQKRSHE